MLRGLFCSRPFKFHTNPHSTFSHDHGSYFSINGGRTPNHSKGTKPPFPGPPLEWKGSRNRTTKATKKSANQRQGHPSHPILCAYGTTDQRVEQRQGPSARITGINATGGNLRPPTRKGLEVRKDLKRGFLEGLGNSSGLEIYSF